LAQFNMPHRAAAGSSFEGCRQQQWWRRCRSVQLDLGFGPPLRALYW